MDINCACAGFIHALEIAESFYKAGRFNEGDLIVMSAFGAGFVSGAALFIW